MLLKHGFKQLKNDKNNVNPVEPLSSDTSMTFREEEIYYNSSLKLYRYISEWTWKVSSWDEFPDITDKKYLLS